MNDQTFFKTLHLNSLNETLTFGQHLAATLKSQDVIALQGNLGTGKTTFARALIQTLCPHVTDIPSPTFTLLQTYESFHPDIPHITHGDFWRLSHPEEIHELGFKDILDNSLFILEWPERIEPFLPPQTLFLEFSLLPQASEETRQLSLKGPLFWKERLSFLFPSFSKVDPS